MAQSNDKRAKPRGANEATPRLELTVGGIGLLLLLTCIGFLVNDGVRNGEAPGAVTASVLQIESVGDAYIVTFKMHNAGSQALANLHVYGRLLDGEREIERATTEFDYLPGHSSQEGGFYFERNPHDFRLDIRPAGYQRP